MYLPVLGGIEAKMVHNTDSAIIHVAVWVSIHQYSLVCEATVVQSDSRWQRLPATNLSPD